MKLTKAVALTASAVAILGGVYVLPAGSSSAVTKSYTLATHPGRILAGNCMQCHGTNGRGGQFDTLGGKSAAEIYSEMKELQVENEGTGIMKVHANAYTDAEIRLLADYFSKS